MHGGLRRGAERAEQCQHLLLLHKPPRRFNALRRAIGIVHGEEFDVAAIDAALFIQHLEIRLADPTKHAVQRTRAAVRHCLSHLDLSVARAGIVFLFRRLDRCGGCEDGSDGGSAELAPRLIVFHCFLHEQQLIHIPGALGNSKITIFWINDAALFKHPFTGWNSILGLDGERNETWGWRVIFIPRGGMFQTRQLETDLSN